MSGQQGNQEDRAVAGMSVLRIVPPSSEVPPIAASRLDAIAHRLRNTIADLDALSGLLRKAGTDHMRDHAHDNLAARLLRSSDTFDDLTAEARRLLDAAVTSRADVGRVHL